MSDIEVNEEWWVDDFRLMAMPGGKFLSSPSVMRNRNTGEKRYVDAPPEDIKKQQEAWKFDRERPLDETVSEVTAKVVEVYGEALRRLGE